MGKSARRGTARVLFVIAVAVSSIAIGGRGRLSLADDSDQAATAADVAAAKKAAAAQKAIAQQKIAAVLRARRAQSQRISTAYDDVFGQGASSAASATSGFGGFSPNFGSAGSSGYGGGTAANATTGTATGSSGSNSTSAGTGATSGSSSNSSTAMTVASQIVQFAQDHLGEKVGSGESKALIDAALSSAGAKPIDQSTSQSATRSAAQGSAQSTAQSATQGTTQSTGQVAGQSTTQNTSADVIPVNSAQPGDILKFENAIFLGMNYWMIMGTPRQWAIVSMIRGNEVILLDQDVNGIRLVQYTTINLSDLHSGTVTAYRAVANDSTGSENQPGDSPGTSAGPSGCRNSSSSSQSGSSTPNSSSQQAADPSGGTQSTRGQRS